MAAAKILLCFLPYYFWFYFILLLLQLEIELAKNRLEP